MALVVYITFRTVSENLKIGDITSQLSFHLFIAFGYFGVHFSVTLSKASRAFSSLTAWYIVLRSFAKTFLSLSGTYLRVFLTWWTMHLWYSVFGKAADMASFMPLKPSAHITRMSLTPRFFNSFNTDNQYLELSLSPTLMLNTSFFPSTVMPRIT